MADSLERVIIMLNAERADAAEVAVTAFAGTVLVDADDGFEIIEIVQDLITDLGHYCERNGIDYVQLCASALAGFLAERKCRDGWKQPRVTIAIDGNVVD
jgi:hypothetical protein